MMLALDYGEVYLLDTSALVAAWVERYPQELFPEVWRFMDGLGYRLKVCEEVRTEVRRHAPGLMDWLDESSVDTQLSLTSLGDIMVGEVQRHLSRIANGWPNWRAIRSRDRADPWVIAYALALNGAVVSEEQPGGREVRIPDVCDTLRAHHLNLLDLFRAGGFGGI